MSYSVIDIKKQTELNTAFKSGLLEAYSNIYSDKPYFEDFSKEEIKGIFNRILDEKGEIILICDAKKKVIGFIAGFGYGSKIYWIEELGIEKKHRRNGLAKKLVQELIRKIKAKKAYDQIQLQTDKENAPAIALYKQFKFKHLKNVFVPSFKIGKKITLDERIIMHKDLTSKPSNQIILSKVAIIDPSGNTTALVFDKTKRNDYTAIANLVMNVIPKVEQVGFVLKSKSDRIRIEMMGQEFCGNAMRCLGKILLKYPMKKIFVETSGLQQLIKLEKNSKEQIQAYIPLKETEVDIVKNKNILVNMPGISHLLVFSQDINEADIKMPMKHIKCQINSPAVGLILINKLKANHYKINPYVYVRETQTLVNEQSCASASIALAYSIFKRNNNKINKSIKILQPSGKNINVYINNKSAKIAGTVDFKEEIRILKGKKGFIFEKNPII